MSDQPLLPPDSCDPQDPPCLEWRILDFAAVSILILLIILMGTVGGIVLLHPESLAPRAEAAPPAPPSEAAEPPDEPKVVHNNPNPDDPVGVAILLETPAATLRLRKVEEEWRSLESQFKDVLDVDTGPAILASCRAAIAAAPVANESAAGCEAREEAMRGRRELDGLPFQPQPHGGSDRTEQLARYAAAIYRAGFGDFSTGRDVCARDLVDDPTFRTPAAIPALEQLLGAEDETGRLTLVRVLARTPGAAASQALARRAIYDFSKPIRQEAARLLRRRPADEYQQILLDGLRYPFAAIAQHASEALIAVGDRRVVRALVAQLSLPDPASPTPRDSGEWERPVLVRINHLRNCLLCHEPSPSAATALPGAIPAVDHFLPKKYPEYKPRLSPSGIFANAGVVHLRPDFSLMQPVAHTKFWPRLQRHDFLIRRTRISAEAACEWLATHPANESPHCQAVLAALRELTSIDAGNNADDWNIVLGAMRARAP